MRLTTWSSVRTIAIFSILGTMVAVAVAISFALPEHYVSRSRFIVEPGDESALLMANRVVQESAFDRHALASLIRDYNLYPRDRGRLSQDALIKEITLNIRVNAGPAVSAGNPPIFDVQFDYPDPHVAERVNLQLMYLVLLHNVAEKANLTFRVLDPPTLIRMPEGVDRVRFACFGLWTGSLAGLTCGLIRLQAASSTHNS
jgi:hypothetical protein